MTQTITATAPDQSNAAQPPRPPKVRSGVPFIGNAIGMLRDPLGFCTRVRERYGPIARVGAGPRSFLLLQGADGVRQILWEKGDLYPKPELGMETLKPLLGRSLATLTDEAEWQSARRFVLPLFTAKMLRSYFDEAVDSIAAEVERLDAHADTGVPVNIYRFMHEAVFRVLIRTIFKRGIGLEEVEELVGLFDQSTAYISARYLTLGLPIAWAIPAARRGPAALARLDERVFRLIADRRAENGSEVRDMLDALLQARTPDGSPLSDQQVRDNCMTLLFGGHETTAGSLTWAWGLLSANPDKRQALLENVDRVLGGKPPEDYSVLADLDYTGYVFSEAMRLYPMFGLLFREVTVPDVIEGCRVEPGDIIAFSAYTIQHAPDLWQDPERFIPERHRPEALEHQHKSSYLPFSQGKRGCIGERMARMEGIVMLALISQKFTLDLVSPLPPPRVSMSLKPEGGMMMLVNRRKPS
ncbi:MAG: cytochrome P450 [Parasphingopyxis sp.]|uniref:cytochrome P450 n=1 Tax=Parasphingopyxis sp. TaxID=1920299 RepID=UPI003FA025F1